MYHSVRFSFINDTNIVRISVRKCSEPERQFHLQVSQIQRSQQRVPGNKLSSSNNGPQNFVSFDVKTRNVFSNYFYSFTFKIMLSNIHLNVSRMGYIKFKKCNSLT